VLMIYRERSTYNPEHGVAASRSDRHQHRNGPVGTCEIAVRAQFTRFRKTGGALTRRHAARTIQGGAFGFFPFCISMISAVQGGRGFVS